MDLTSMGPSDPDWTPASNTLPKQDVTSNLISGRRFTGRF